MSSENTRITFQEYWKTIQESIKLFSNIYTHLKVEIVAFMVQNQWSLAHGQVTCGIPSFFSEPIRLPLPSEILHISDICPISRLRNIVKTILSETPMIRYQKYKVQFKVRGPRPEEPFISSSRRPSISFSDFDLLPGKTLTDEIRRTGRVNL